MNIEFDKFTIENVELIDAYDYEKWHAFDKTHIYLMITWKDGKIKTYTSEQCPFVIENLYFELKKVIDKLDREALPQKAEKENERSKRQS